MTKAFGNRRHVVAKHTPDYPEDSIQHWTGDWWVPCPGKALTFGSLVWSYVPYFEQVPFQLAAARKQPDDHSTAVVEVRPLFAKQRINPADALPVAALPGLPGLRGAHSWLLFRAKKRPCLVLCDPATSLPETGQVGEMAKSSAAQYALVAPFYGVEQVGRAGYEAPFVEQIKHAVYPQWFWDQLPVGDEDESLMLLDQAHPLSVHHQVYEHTGFALSPSGRDVIRDWLHWFLGEGVSDDIRDFKRMIPEL